MIDIRELKINNLVSFRGKEIKIIGVRNDNDIPNILFRDGDRTMALDVEEAEPIPLTPEWLQKFQFIDPAKNGMAYRINISSVDELCWYVQDGFLRYQTQLNGFTRQLPHINSAHLLQNYFYFLTGRELELKSFNQSN